jgi:hypothetical protein
MLPTTDKLKMFFNTFNTFFHSNTGINLRNS